MSSDARLPRTEYLGRYSEVVRTDSNTVRKLLWRGSNHTALREFECATIAYISGIQTPKPKEWGQSNASSPAWIDFTFVELVPGKILPQTARSIAYDIAQLEGNPQIRKYWQDDMNEYFTTVELTRERLSKREWTRLRIACDLLSAAETNCFIHGDFSPQNLPTVDGQPWVVDWQLAGVGPEGWDFAFYLATSGAGYDDIPTDLIPWCSLVAAVKVGNRIRRGDNYDLNRLRECLSWS